jgi:hypothetical protein
MLSAEFKNLNLIRGRIRGGKASLLTVISIDQAYQQGEKFKAFIELVNDTPEIEELIIVQTGYLKRFYTRLNPKLNVDEADRAAEQLGQDWVVGQKKYMEFLKKPYQIISWKKVLEFSEHDNNEDYLKFSKIVKNDYECNDEAFKDKVDKLSNSYAKKLLDEWQIKAVTLDYNRCFQASRNYLLEEGSIIYQLVKLAKKLNIAFITYPDRSNPALKHIYDKYFCNNDSLPKDLLPWVQSDPLPWLQYEIGNEKKWSAKYTQSQLNALSDRIKLLELNNSSQAYYIDSFNHLGFFKHGGNYGSSTCSDDFLYRIMVAILTFIPGWNSNQKQYFNEQLEALITEINEYPQNGEVNERSTQIQIK